MCRSLPAGFSNDSQERTGSGKADAGRNDGAFELYISGQRARTENVIERAVALCEDNTIGPGICV